MKRIACSVLVTALAFSSVAAADPSKRECIDANADAQVKQKEGKLHAAQTSLRVCMSASCPGAVRDDCTQRLDALSALVPTLIFEAKDPSGTDLSTVKVTADGQPFAERLDGNPLEVDPGEHTFTFETAGAALVTRKLIVRQGERARHEQIVLGSEKVVAKAPDTKPAIAATEPPSEPPAGRSNQKTLGIVAAAIGVAGVGAGAVMGLMASSKWSSAQEACTTTSCSDRNAAQSDRDSALGLATGSTIAFIAGGVFLAGGVVLWLTAPSSANRVGLAPAPNGAVLRGRF